MAKLVVRKGRNVGTEHPLPLESQRVVLGRRSGNDIQVLDEQSSRDHAELTRADDLLVLRDLGSSNGTFVNDELAKGRVVLRLGDKIRIGETVYELVDETRLSEGGAATDDETSVDHSTVDRADRRAGPQRSAADSIRPTKVIPAVPRGAFFRSRTFKVVVLLAAVVAFFGAAVLVALSSVARNEPASTLRP